MISICERTENGTTTYVSVKEALAEVNHAMMAGKKDVREMSSGRGQHSITYKDGRKVRLVVREAQATGPKGQTQPQNRWNQMDFRALSLERQAAVRLNAEALHSKGGLTPAKAWSAALRLDWIANLPPVPDESEFGMCIAVNGGEVHSFSKEGCEGYPVTPLCRTMDQNNRGTHYTETKAQDITCKMCKGYREGRAKRRSQSK